MILFFIIVGVLFLVAIVALMIRWNEDSKKKAKLIGKLEFLSGRIQDYDVLVKKISRGSPDRVKRAISEVIEKYSLLDRLSKYKDVMKNYDKKLKKLESFDDNVLLRNEIDNIEKKYSIIREIATMREDIDNFDEELKKLESLNDHFIIKHEVLRIKECANEIRKIYDYKHLIKNFDQVLNSLKKIGYPSKIKNEVESIISGLNISDRIKIGMNKDEVVEILGTPLKSNITKGKQKTKEVFEYSIRGEKNMFTFSDGKLIKHQNG